MIRQLGENIFVLDTKRTSYVIKILPTLQPAHLYYGKYITVLTAEDAEVLEESEGFVPGNSTYYDEENKQLCLETIKQEMSSTGKGDMDEPFVELTYADGNMTSDFLFEDAYIYKGKKEALGELPGSYGEEEQVQTLELVLKERHEEIKLHLYYYVYEESDVICRNTVLENQSSEPVYINRIMSTQLDVDFKEVDESGYSFTSFNGAWAKEMHKNTRECKSGLLVNGSTCGTSSNHANPFVMLHENGADEQKGEVYGFNLIYSGNHEEIVSVGAYGRLRFLAGINKRGFEWKLEPGEAFCSPEAVMTYSNTGFGNMSRNLHRFVRKHIVRGEWRDRERPVLFNSWESCYFDINESKLISLAKKAADAGIELFVVDDGWFGERNDDSTSLGDWSVNKKKLPHGLSGLSDKIHGLGLKLGIWVEPEMVSRKSRLYEAHPEWVLKHPGREHAEGRNQLLLNLSLREVQDYIIDSMSLVFDESRCDYVKWDYNRNFSDVFSAAKDGYRTGEISHRYMLGLYRVMKTLTEKYPHILFEGCAAGGNRFDLGILSYFPQIWASDDTDPICRSDIQEGYSYGYPLSVISAHVGSSPNHQTLRKTDIFTRFAVAAFGQLGYEFNILDMNSEEFERMKRQIEFYKHYRKMIMDGSFYRIKSTSVECCFELVSRAGKKAVMLQLRKKALPNTYKRTLRFRGIKPTSKYRIHSVQRPVNIKVFGDLVNTMAPIHIKPDSLIQSAVSKVIKLQTPAFEKTAYGDALMNAGVQLPQAYAGTGYSDKIFLATDFSAEMYIADEVE